MKVTLSHYINEKNNKYNKKLKLITESKLTNKTIINVDIQPEYKDYITFDIYDWVKFINTNYKNNTIVFLYNGYDTLGMVEEYEYKEWLKNELGIKENIINNSIFYDKGYAFFRYCIDSGINQDNIVDLVKFMIKHNITDSRDIDSDMWNLYKEETNHSQQDVIDLLDNAGDCINIPDLMDFLENYNNIVLTGGGIDECLKEVEIALLALDKDYNILDEYTY